ncbi:adenylate/guanylate cyclase domain-containing protein [Lusitaniella coriacea]|nr:adenylate/guanylate cyclase domain-containing protein [Lusitaniella coriacea]
MTRDAIEQHKGNILVVDDIPANLHLLVTMLRQQGYEVRAAVNGHLAISGAKTILPDLILLDIMMPEMDGYEVCQQLKANEKTQEIPVIFLSALDDTVDKVKAFEVGGVDYISKPFQKEEVFARIENQLHLRSLQKRVTEKNQQLQKFNANLKQLHRLNTTSYQNLEELCNDYLQTGCQMLEVPTGIVSRIENQCYTLQAFQSEIPELPTPQKFDLEDTHCALVLQSKKTIAYAGADNELKPQTIYIGTPIWVNESIYGILSFFRTDPCASPPGERCRDRAFASQEIDIIELMAQSLGKWIATHQAEIERQRAEEETQLLLTVTQAISQAPDFISALEDALAHVCEASGWSYGEAWIPSADRSMLECSPAWYWNCSDLDDARAAALKEFRDRSLQLTFTPNEGLLGRVWMNGEPAYLANITTESYSEFNRNDLAQASGMKSALAIPIVAPPVASARKRVPGKVLAILMFLLLESSQTRPHPQEERLAELASAVATQLGTIMQQKQVEAEQRAIFSAMTDLVIVKDRSGRCLKVAPTKTPQNWAISALEITGKTLHELFPADIADRLVASIEQTLETRETTNLEYNVRMSDREMWLEATISPLSENTVIWVGRDISDRKRSELALRIANQKSESLLLNILPRKIAEQLKQTRGAIAEQFDDVTILFADIVDFTPLSAQMSPIELVNLLNQIFSTFDKLAEHYGLEKIKTIGDAYMVVGGLPDPMPNHASAIADMALAMRLAIIKFQPERIKELRNGQPLQIRIGINTGSVVAGVIGMRKFIYDLWGDTVNVASRMESQGEAGRIQITQETYERLNDSYSFEKRGLISVKGRGEMTTYWLAGKKD